VYRGRSRRRISLASFGARAAIGHNDSGMTTWKAHSLATPHPDQLDLDRGDTVRSTVELPGVPVGMSGKVILANGFNWLRYRVRFANGVERADLDGRHLEPTGRAARRLAKRQGR
jgi:hypothetical protein